MKVIPRDQWIGCIERVTGDEPSQMRVRMAKPRAKVSAAEWAEQRRRIQAKASQLSKDTPQWLSRILDRYANSPV